MDAVTVVPLPVNDPVKQYAPGSPERAELEGTLKRMAAEPRDLTMTIGGARRPGGGEGSLKVLAARSLPPSSTVQRTKFIGGVPMKLATKRFCGRS